VPITAVGLAHTLQLPIEVSRPLPALSDFVVRRLGLPLLQHEQPVTLPQSVQRRDAGPPPESMYDHHGRGPRGHGRLDSGRVQAVAHRIYVGEHRKRTGQDNSLGDLDVPEGRHHDLVTDSDAGGPEHCSSTHASDGGRGT
jgi:hypothetical protein